MDQTLRIGEVAEAAGLSAAAIRFYETEGVLPEPERSSSGYRNYSAEDLDLIRFVSRLRGLEFPLTNVREIVALRRDRQAPCGAVRSAISQEVSAITTRINDLKKLQSELLDLEAKAKDLPDDWPSVCVCNVIEGSAPTSGAKAP